ncbi:uncharacterized protein PAC_15451 [Phialocephala subalpina]|uniref:Alcohol dehydrogenase-like N-terminal domain-containing protein n=1 Tax=Phialocephala subalpina TaxID=576137 RepID=A0A1L7XKH0_9HELO|nr:uncharacterized protein PAC_15451 [Phialocephala subalpina]
MRRTKTEESTEKRMTSKTSHIKEHKLSYKNGCADRQPCQPQRRIDNPVYPRRYWLGPWFFEGFDTVGEIVEIGSGVTGFEKGQKVVTFATGIGPAKYSAFEQYFLAQASTSWTFGFKLPRFPGSISPLHTGNSFNSHRPSPP